jgi:DNA invertase Pin-like site-specific DNA recombinase
MPQRALTVANAPASSQQRAAAYVRMSTDAQVYSTFNQMTLIKQYAVEHNLQIVRIYSDEGISGLRIENRPGLNTLLSEIVRGRADYSKLLVYDVSRWGRFQDIDESAHYEFICRRRGVGVIYCAEPFSNDQSLISSIGKVLKRGAAAEWSRELSVKVFRASCNIANRGFALGGSARYGLKKVLVDENGKRIRRPFIAERKTQTGCRLNLAPGPLREVRVVKEIFKRYVELRETPGQIANHLNAKGLRTRNGRPWGRELISSMLKEEKYIGTLIYNRLCQKMRSTARRNPQSAWIRKPNAFPAIVDPEIFRRAQQRLQRIRSKPTNPELLEMLRILWSKKGYLSQALIAQQRGMASPFLYMRRFGSLFNAYKLVGYRCQSASARGKFARRALRNELIEQVKAVAQSAGRSIASPGTSICFYIDGTVACSLQLMRCRSSLQGATWYRRDLRYLSKRARAAAFHILVPLYTVKPVVRDAYLVPARTYNAFVTVIRASIYKQVSRQHFSTLREAVLDMLNETNGSQRWLGRKAQ